jgi:hypothetical protein
MDAPFQNIEVLFVSILKIAGMKAVPSMQHLQFFESFLFVLCTEA